MKHCGGFLVLVCGSLSATSADSKPPERLSIETRFMVWDLQLSPNGKSLASCAWKDTPYVRVWETTTGKEELVLKHERGPIYSVAFSPDGKVIASSAGRKTIQLWDALTGKSGLVLNGETGGNRIVYSADGKLLAAGDITDELVEVWDVATGKVKATLRGHTKGTWSMAFTNRCRKR
jgi:WD40 repeat protein